MRYVQLSCKIQAEIELRENYPKYLASKLDVTHRRIGNQEEFYANRLISFITKRYPKTKILFVHILASENHMVSFLNVMRTGMFDDFIAKYPNATLEELTAYSDVINKATGRGNVAALGQSLKYFNKIFWSTKLLASRLQYPLTIWKYRNQPRVRKMVAKQMVSGVGVTMGLLMLADLHPDWEVEWDWWESDFLKIRRGNTRYDIWASFLPVIRLVIRGMQSVLARDEVRTKMVKLDMPDFLIKPEKKRMQPYRNYVMDFLAYKLAPVVTLPYNLITGKDILGRDISAGEALLNGFTPMTATDIREAWAKDGIEAGAEAGVFSLIGGGVTTYETGKKKPKSKPKRTTSGSSLTSEKRWESVLGK